MAVELIFDVWFDGEIDAGLLPYTDEVTITVKNDPGGDPEEFEEHMRSVLSEWYDGAVVQIRRKEQGES